ncbi:hypothetical protein [Thermogemmatispora sp.]|uniref:hypothetical protein n=1 Tax=Thermogemmatispora sp. TaxID=1968838 RepID=UPI0035E45425
MSWDELLFAGLEDDDELLPAEFVALVPPECVDDDEPLLLDGVLVWELDDDDVVEPVLFWVALALA